MHTHHKIHNMHKKDLALLPISLAQYPLKAHFEPMIGWLRATRPVFPLSASQLQQALARKVGHGPTVNPNV